MPTVRGCRVNLVWFSDNPVDGVVLFPNQVYAGPMLFLGRIRLSVSSDESTSVERQREVITKWADLHEHTIVGWAEDIDVSGKLSPFDTPQFGHWLNSRYPEFDGIVAWKLDRLARNMFGLNDLFQWARSNSKTIVSITESLDLSTTVGVMVAQILGGVAQMELEAIQARQAGSQAHLRQVGRWPGGNAPYGYRVVRNGKGCALDVNPDTAPVLNEIVHSVLNGDTMAAVCRKLNAAGVPAPQGGQWRIGTLRYLLHSPALRGQRMHRGEVILDADGQPVMFGPELMDAETFQRLQAILAPGNGAGVRKNASPLGGLLHCSECRRPLGQDTSSSKGRKYRYYRAHKECPHRVGMRAEVLENIAEATLLWTFGDREITQRQWVAGNENAQAIADATKRAVALGERLGVTASKTMANVLQGQLDAVESELARLEALPKIEGHWEQIGTGRTWAAEWGTADVGQRRTMLREAGLSFLVGDSVTVAVNGSPHIDRTEAARRYAGTPVRVGLP